MVKPNYGFQKRQRELAKKQKKEAKRQRASATDQATPAAEEETPPASETSGTGLSCKDDATGLQRENRNAEAAYGHLDLDDFPRELAACDLIVWTSNPERYAVRVSGVVWETVASERPVNVSSRCLHAQIALRHGAATCFHQPTASSVLRWIDEDIANYAALARHAENQARRWQATEGTRAPCCGTHRREISGMGNRLKICPAWFSGDFPAGAEIACGTTFEDRPWIFRR